MTYHDLKKEAVQLRNQGYSYSLISEKLNVSKSTLSGWLSKISYTPNAEVVERVGKARALAGARKSELKRNSIREARRLAEKEIEELSKRDLFMLGIALYIGEGSKHPDFIRVINADPRIINLAIRWFRDVCDVPKENLHLLIHLYPDNNVEESLNYWSEVTGIPRDQFGKTQVDKRENKKNGKRGKLPNGTAHLSVKSKGNILHGAFLRRKIDAWMDIVLDDAGLV